MVKHSWREHINGAKQPREQRAENTETHKAIRYDMVDIVIGTLYIAICTLLT